MPELLTELIGVRPRFLDEASKHVFELIMLLADACLRLREALLYASRLGNPPTNGCGFVVHALLVKQLGCRVRTSYC